MLLWLVLNFTNEVILLPRACMRVAAMAVLEKEALRIEAMLADSSDEDEE